jgi:phospholipid transport system substrate-binding protein
MLKKKFFLNLILFTILFPLNSVYSMEPDVFVQSTVNRASNTLSAENTKEERIEELKKIALDTVDITGIGFYSLGSHRKNLSENDVK